MSIVSPKKRFLLRKNSFTTHFSQKKDALPESNRKDVRIGTIDQRYLTASNASMVTILTTVTRTSVAFLSSSTEG